MVSSAELARFYDSAQGRILAKDPVKSGLNGYPYCDNDPVDYVDPTGEVPFITGGIIGGIVGGIAGFLDDTFSQIKKKEKYSLRKALGAAAKGAITGAAQGALTASGAGLGASLLTNFGARFLGSMAEQKISKRRVNPREAIREGLISSIGDTLFGNSPLKGIGNAMIRGARSGAAVAAINNIFDSFTPTEQERIHDFMRNLPLGTTLVLELPEMRDDPRDACDGKNPFHDGVGYGLSNGNGSNGGRKGFSLVDFLKDVAAGAVIGGLSGAAYYGGDSAIKALRNSSYKKKIIPLIDGKTRQSTKIADALRKDKIKLHIMEDKEFETIFKVDRITRAIAIDNHMFIRKKSKRILSNVIHEGTHALDYIHKYAYRHSKSVWSREKRAYFFERQFQIATGRKVRFETIDDMLVHIQKYYPNKPHTPYKKRRRK